MYIIGTGTGLFIKSTKNHELVLTEDNNKAIQYDTIGAAMQMAALLNEKLGNVLRVINV